MHICNFWKCIGAIRTLFPDMLILFDEVEYLITHIVIIDSFAKYSNINYKLY